jgi:tetraprenyl-beta-curcumene synthase
MATLPHPAAHPSLPAPPAALQAPRPRAQRRPRPWHRAAHVLVFARTVLCYLLLVLPRATRELSHWRARAESIPDPSLRTTALAALAKRGNLEGAALFATLAPRRHRRASIRALVAFQAAYNYLDALSERADPPAPDAANADPALRARRLHQQLLVALTPAAGHEHRAAPDPDRAEDAGFLAELVNACRGALCALPSYPLLTPCIRTAAQRIVDFQTLTTAAAHGKGEQLPVWARAAGPPGCERAWWEIAASAGSSLLVHALIATAAQPGLNPALAPGLQDAYFPWLGALHSLLDSLADQAEDRASGQPSLIAHYGSPPEATRALSALATHGLQALEDLRVLAREQRVIVAAMCSYYLSCPSCRDDPDARLLAHALTGVFGLPLRLALVMFRVRRAVHPLTHRGRAYV